MSLAPEISAFGDGTHDAGETGLAINGGGYGAFPGEVWMFENADRSGAADQLTVGGSWDDIQLSGIEIPASPNNAAGTVYLMVMREDLAWSNAFEFTLVIPATEAAFIGPNIANLTLAVGAPVSRNYAGRFDGPGLTFSEVGSYPPGLSINAAGQLVGTPTTPGVYSNLRIEAEDENTETAQSNLFTITVITGARGDIGGGNMGSSDIGGADIGGPDVDTPLQWVN